MAPELLRSSPHTRRYFPPEPGELTDEQLFSAHAEVFPASEWLAQAADSLLRTRGGISMSKTSTEAYDLSSPHTRRYFRVEAGCDGTGELFSAHAEVFPRCHHDGRD
ncbi:hypothetical protein cgR_6044 [Corynebacterium glutamicum R]|uniref:Uncharacterized protein n=1 Tax=Corynebacterium glutamicum (strain R) TaxID=340322 RepID=A0AB72VF80_CORGB|nr:hypothetical protein cgR_6044 [Corynebacterium glutamicum R]